MAELNTKNFENISRILKFEQIKICHQKKLLKLDFTGYLINENIEVLHENEGHLPHIH